MLVSIFYYIYRDTYDIATKYTENLSTRLIPCQTPSRAPNVNLHWTPEGECNGLVKTFATRIRARLVHKTCKTSNSTCTTTHSTYTRLATVRSTLA